MKTLYKKDRPRYIKDYYSNSSTVDGYTNDKLFPAEELIFQKYFKHGTSILDIGCGAGRTSIALALKGYSVTAMDLVPEMIESAKQQAGVQKVKIDFSVMDAVNMDYESESFDNILFSYNGLENIPGKANREKFFRDVFNILKPVGYFIFTIRSGFAFGRRMIMWLLMILSYPCIRIFSNSRSWELGDKVRGGLYIHYLSPFYLKSLVCKVGFEPIYFNSSANILKKKKSNFFTNFSNDKMIFFVLKKD